MSKVKLEHNLGFRVLAFCIDYMLLFVIGLIFGILFGYGDLQSGNGGFSFYMTFLETMLVAAIYFASFAILNKGKTVGKLITKIEIYSEDVKELDMTNLLLREAIKVLLFIPSIISFLFVVFRKDNRSIHDILIHSQVLRKAVDKEYVYLIKPQKLEEAEAE